MDELIGYQKIEVEKFSLDSIPFLYFRNKDVFDSVKKRITGKGVKILSIETPRQTFLNIIGMRKGRRIKVFYYKYSRTRPNLIPVYCKLIGIRLETNECAWVRDTFFHGDIIITPDEIIGDDNLDMFYARPV